MAKTIYGQKYLTMTIQMTMWQWQSTVNTVDYNTKPHRRHTATMSKTIMTFEHNNGLRETCGITFRIWHATMNTEKCLVSSDNVY